MSGLSISQRRVRPWLAFVGVLAVVMSALVALPVDRAEAAVKPGPASFVDVPANHPFHGDISWLSQKGITTGWVDGTFRPSESVSRAAFAAFLYRMRCEPAWQVPASSPFKDVPVSHQFYREITWLAAQGITKGWPDGTFRPEDKIGRDAIATFLYRFAGEPSFVATKSFKDTATSEHRKSIDWMATVGISTGWDDGTFRPGNQTERGAIAAFLHRYSDKGLKTCEPAVTPTPTATPTVKPSPTPTSTPSVKPTTPAPTTPAPTPTTPAPVKVSSLALSGVPVNGDMLVGDSAALTVEVKPANAANKAVVWASSNTAVVTVDASGTISAVGAGTATITVTAQDGSGKKATVKVTVTEPEVIVNKDVVPLEEDKAGTQGEPDVLEVTENTVMVDADTHLKKGSVIIAGVTEATPEGLLRKVTRLEDYGGEVLLETEPAALTDVFDKVDFEARVVMNDAGEWVIDEQSSDSGLELALAALVDSGSSKSFSLYSKSGQWDEGRGRWGSSASLYYDVRIRIDFGDVYFKVVAGMKGSMNVEHDEYVWDKGFGETLYDHNLPPIQFVIPTPLGGMPVVINSNFWVELSGSFELSGLEWQMAGSLDRAFGFEFSSSKGLTWINENNSKMPTFTLAPNGKLFTAQAEAQLSFNLAMRIYDMAGPDFSVGLKAESQADVTLVPSNVTLAGAFQMPGLDSKLRGEASLKVTVPISGKFVLALPDFNPFDGKGSEPLLSKKFVDTAVPLYEKHWGPVGGLIPDRELEKCINSKLGLDEDNVVTEAQLKKLTELTCYSVKKTLQGLEKATNLTDLSISSYYDVPPYLENIDALSGLKNLQYLSITMDGVEAITLDGFPRLESLSIQGAHSLRELSLSNMPSLGSLTVENNHVLNTVTLTNMKALESADLSDNAIINLSTSGLTGMKYLNVDFNSLQGTSGFAGMSNLNDLSLSYNPISDLSGLTGLKNLRTLDLHENNISNVSPLSGLSNLKELYLYDNQISQIASLASLTNLNTLKLGNNQIVNVSPLGKLVHLKKLDLYGNQISDISALAPLKALTHLDLDSNQIVNIGAISGMTSLEVFHASNNQIADVTPLAKLSNGAFYLRDNHITDASSIVHLSVDLDGNPAADTFYQQQQEYWDQWWAEHPDGV